MLISTIFDFPPFEEEGMAFSSKKVFNSPIWERTLANWNIAFVLTSFFVIRVRFLMYRDRSLQTVRVSVSVSFVLTECRRCLIFFLKLHDSYFIGINSCINQMSGHLLFLFVQILEFFLESYDLNDEIFFLLQKLFVIFSPLFIKSLRPLFGDEL